MLDSKEKLAQYFQANKPLRLNFKQLSAKLKLSKQDVLKSWNSLNNEDRIVIYDNLILECWNNKRELPDELSPKNIKTNKNFYISLGQKLHVNPHSLIFVYAEAYQVPAFPNDFKQLVKNK